MPAPRSSRRPARGGTDPAIRRAARGAVERAGSGRTGSASVPPKSPRVRRVAAPDDIRTEIVKAAGAGAAERVLGILAKASDAIDRGRDRDAVRLLRPVREQIPDAPTVCELLGVALYHVGRYEDARRELDTYHQISGRVDRHPVLMDCLRALRRYRRIAVLWEELARVSPAGEIVTEGRIVMAGALADQGDLVGAIRLLERGPVEAKRVHPHHLRLWYALGDLQERSGNLPRARAYFERVRAQDPQFVDVANRIANLA